MKLRNLAFVSAILILVAVQGTRVLALQTGAISDHVTDTQTNDPVADAQVTSVAPTGKYKATSTSTGFYSMVGLPPDTYVITATKNGYDVATTAGVTVTQGGSSRSTSSCTKQPSLSGGSLCVVPQDLCNLLSRLTRMR